MSGSVQVSRQGSGCSDYSLPRLGTASNSKLEVTQEFKSGARYHGQIEGTKKAGRGVFEWPNGARYEGEFLDNNRQGTGIQTWADGSKYEGDFQDDMRHGQGYHTWANGESYIGTFYRDRRHGKGEYTWPDGAVFTGFFYMDRKESYGTLTLSNGNKFEGLYKADEREGPGVLTYPDGRQDVGMWHRQKLVRLCSATPAAFTMTDHPELEYYPDEHKTYINMAFNKNHTDVISDIVNPPQQFDYPPSVNIQTQTSNIFSDTLSFSSNAIDVKIFEQEFFKNCEKDNEAKVVAWNNTPSMMAMQRHTLRYKTFETDASFDVSKVIQGERSGFGPKGPIEEASEKLIQSAMTGEIETVSQLLDDDEVSADVADCHGFSPLMAASVHWHKDIINALLDSGADVNKLSDEGVSSLAACHVFYYPADSFKYNIAEKGLEKPAGFTQEAGYDVNEAVKSLIPQTPKRKTAALPSKKKIKDTDAIKIQKFKQEYNKIDNKLRNIEEDNDELELAEEFDSLNIERERTLGQLQVKRVTKTNVEDIMAYDEQHLRNDYKDKAFSDGESETEIDDFESLKSVHNMPITVPDELIERCATQLSSNNMVVDRVRSAKKDLGTIGTARQLAMDKSNQKLMESVIALLLRRGADPNASVVPMPVLFFAIKTADVKAVHNLLLKGASATATISPQKGGLTPLHIAVAIPGDEGVLITELLLHSLAQPDARAAEDDSYLNHSLEDEWSKDVIEQTSQQLLGGRTPLHIACARDDNYKNACRVVRLLLQHHANPNLLCNGHSPLALCIISGNDMAIDELLLYGADVCLPLTHGVGSTLCVAANTDYESRRTPEGRIKLINKLIEAGGDILAPIAIGPKRVTGTAVDYAYYVYNLDRRIAHMPYHALSHAERETFNARRNLLAHMGDILRNKAVERERYGIQLEEAQGKTSGSPSPDFVYTGAGAKVPPGSRSGGHVSFGRNSAPREEIDIRKPLFRYCYECGRSVGVRLSPCTRCKEVFYCSKACKLKAWNARHKEECVRLGGRSRSPSPKGGGNRIDSPTPGTDPDAGKPNTVTGIMNASRERIKTQRYYRSRNRRQRFALPPIGKSGLVGQHSNPSSGADSPYGSNNNLNSKGRPKHGKHKASAKGKVQRSASWGSLDSEESYVAQGHVKNNNWVRKDQSRRSDKSKGKSKGQSKDGKNDNYADRQSEHSPKKSQRSQSGREKPSKNKEDDEYEEFIRIKYGKKKVSRSGAAAVEDADEFEEYLKLKERIQKRGIAGLDLANNPLLGKPPRPGQRNPAIFLLKLPSGGRVKGLSGFGDGEMRYKTGAVMDRGTQLAMLRLREAELQDNKPYDPWRFIEGKWVYLDNYSYV